MGKALKILLVMTLLTGIAYPLAVTGLAQVIFPKKAAGSLLIKEGQTIGSSLIGQNFSASSYFQSRPSAAGEKGYDAANSSGSNKGPTNKAFLETVAQRAEKVRTENGLAPNFLLPGDLITASASGLDPHISPEAARLQVARVAGNRNLSAEKVQELVDRYTENRQFGFLGEPRVNVLKLNMALDSF
jgi:K+-transporting ATPase ATPase C chain